VANIFAPNIIVANPPLNDDGFPDISFSRWNDNPIMNNYNNNI
jgi:hypothetical protein